MSISEQIRAAVRGMGWLGPCGLAHKNQQVELVVLPHECRVDAGEACGFSSPPYRLAAPPSTHTQHRATYHCAVQHMYEHRYGYCRDGQLEPRLPQRGRNVVGILLGRMWRRTCCHDNAVWRPCHPSDPVRHMNRLRHLHNIQQPFRRFRLPRASHQVDNSPTESDLPTTPTWLLRTLVLQRARARGARARDTHG